MDTKINKKNTAKNKDQKIYGLYLLADQNSGETDLAKASKKIKKILTENNSTILNEQAFKKIELSYPIKKSLYAYNSQVKFETDPSNIPPINESIREITESIIRYIITKEPVQKDMPDYTKKERSITKEQNKPEKKEMSLEDMETQLDNIKI